MTNTLSTILTWNSILLGGIKLRLALLSISSSSWLASCQQCIQHSDHSFQFQHDGLEPRGSRNLSSLGAVVALLFWQSMIRTWLGVELISENAKHLFVLRYWHVFIASIFVGSGLSHSLIWGVPHTTFPVFWSSPCQSSTLSCSSGHNQGLNHVVLCQASYQNIFHNPLTCHPLLSDTSLV